MPWKKVKNHPRCPKSKPIGVVKTADGELEGCHSSQASANRQLAALNASERKHESPNFGDEGNGPFTGPVLSLPLGGEVEAKMSKSKRRRPRRSKRKAPAAPRIALEAQEAYDIIDKIRGNDDGQEPVIPLPLADEAVDDGDGNVPADTPVPALAMKEQASDDDLPDVGNEKEDDDEKMYDGDMAVPVQVWHPLGGSETWPELDDYLEAEDFEQSTRQASFEFGRMVNNIFQNSETNLAEKGQKVAALAEGLAERAEDIREKDVDESETKTTWEGTIANITDKLLKARPSKTESGIKLFAGDYASVGNATKPGTWKLPLVKKPGVPDAGRIAAAITALQPGGFRGNPVRLTASRSSVISKIRGAIGRLKAKDDVKGRLRKRVDAVKAFGSTGFVTFKDLEQRDRWFGWVTNNFRDRDVDASPELGGEILTDEAHKDFVAWVEKDPGKRMPQLWPWHTKEGAHEHRADWIGYVNGFLLMSGPLEPDEAKAIERVAEEWELGMSHGFYALSRDQEKGLVEQYRSFEVSYLPLEFAANMWTDFITVGDRGR